MGVVSELVRGWTQDRIYSGFGSSRSLNHDHRLESDDIDELA